MRLSPVEYIGMERIARARLGIPTSGPGFTDLTDGLAGFLSDCGARDGALTVFIRHTSASLTIQENADPDVRRDLMDALDGLAPQNAGYRHGMEGPDDMPAHIRTMLTDVSLTVPVRGGRLDLGTWQSVYLVEHRTRPHERTVDLIFVGC
jgi:secondary thiamine-phosphate synthase enzyme